MRYIKLSRPNQIELPRGDSETYDVGIVVNGEEYTPVEGDSIRFALKRAALAPDKSRYIDDSPLLVKTIPIDTMQLVFEPADTKPFPFGVYEYDMEITFSDGRVKTFIESSPFILKREVH